MRLTALHISAASDSTESVIHLARVGTHDNKRFDWTTEKFQQLVTNFKAGAYGLFDENDKPILPVNFGHHVSGEAAGWITDVFVEGDDLKARVKWTPVGVQAIRDKRYLFPSAEWYLDYADDKTGESKGLVLSGAGLVNDPAIKELDVLVATKNQNKGNNMAKFEKAAVADMTVDDVLAWIKTASMEDQMKISELVDTMVPDAPSDSMPPAAPGMAEVKPAEQKASSELERLQGTVKDLESKLELASRESAFNKLFANGQVVEAQREAFLKNDMVAFASAFVPGLNMSAHGVKSNRMEAESAALDSDDQEVLKTFKGVITKEMLLKNKNKK